MPERRVYIKMDRPILEEDKEWLNRLACIPCNKLKEKKVEFKGIEIKPLFTIGAIFLTMLLLLRKNEK